MEAKAKVNKCDLVKLKSVARRKPLKKPKKTTYGKEENICKWHDQQCINFQNILIGFKVNLKRFPTPEAEKQITLLVQDFRWLLTVVLDRTASYHDFMCMQTHTETKRSQNNITIALCSDIFCHASSILLHIKDKMMITMHKINFIIHQLHLKFDSHCPCLTPVGLGSWSMLASHQELHCVSDCHGSLARLTLVSSNGTVL